LKGIEWQQSAPALQPRGMINQGNMCFENSVCLSCGCRIKFLAETFDQILQVLVFCAPFYNLMHALSQHLRHDLSGKTRLLEATYDTSLSALVTALMSY
jgi:ubiquitin carboxyl-terminal hydrolase 10